MGIDIGSDGAGRFFFGGRFAQLDQSYNVTYDDTALGNIYTRNARMDVEAFGVLAGFEREPITWLLL